MLISKVLDEAGGEDGRVAVGEAGDPAPEYQTASELFELMTRDSHFDSNNDDSLTARDLVLLYKNIDIGTKLMNDATGLTLKRPNQYVETIVCNDDPDSESDTSEIYTADDVQNVFMVNQERLDFLNDNSLGNLLCPKLGRLEINPSELSMDYDKRFLFKDPYIKNQLTNLNVTGSGGFDTIFSTSLIDYICCKRLEDNYNFYMENIIRYVQHTIEHLKRISNGDYLTDRAKEKWREVNSKHQENNTKVLTTSTSIPLHVQCKTTGNATWDDIVHSAVDVRSLSKILEKKIIVEIPKLICGSYQLNSKRCADNLIISCQRKKQKIEEESQAPRVDVVLQLQRSQTGQVMSNISSIMILRTTPALPDLRAIEILPLPFNEENGQRPWTNGGYDPKDPKVTVIELSEDSKDFTGLDTEIKPVGEITEEHDKDYPESENGGSFIGTNDYPLSESCGFASILDSSESSLIHRNLSKSTFQLCSNETSYNLISPDQLRVTMQRLNMQTSTLDESGEDLVSQSTSKRRSPIRARVKSPYENKSFLMEEKKRKRLLEIREKREKKKMALSENCKISKHKYGRGAIMPQASSSVTKLSITNKSFYNSIYGQNLNAENKPTNARKAQRSNTLGPDVFPIEETQGDYSESPMLTPEKNSKKYINRSYYLDDTETEMMYMQMKQSESKEVQNTCSISNSLASNEFKDNLNLLTEFIGPSDTNLNSNQTCLADDKLSSYGEDSLLTLPISNNAVVPNKTNDVQLTSKKSSSGDECRKSIDQLYDLINKFKKPNVPTDFRTKKCKVDTNVDTVDRVGSTIQGSDSGTSVKHHTPSNHSGFSTERNNTALTKSKSNKNQATVVQKVIISSKLQSPKIETDKTKKDRRRSVVSPPFKGISDNPLKAISQLLHEFDHVQKTRQRPAPEVRSPKKKEIIPNDNKTISPSSYRRRSRLEQHNNDKERKVHPPLFTFPKDRRARPVPPAELSRNPHQQIMVEDKNIDKLPKKKVIDIIDEAKEARGEAVRGPSILNTRLNSLAQPKKSYVQAHHKEYQNRYGKNMLAERLQRLVAAPSPAPPLERNVMSPNTRNRLRRFGTEATSAASVKHPASSMPHLDKGARSMWFRRSASSSPSREVARPPPAAYTHGRPRPVEPEETRKMVAVESYVKNHYGRLSVPAPNSEVPLSGHRCRVPLVPLDLELASMTSTPSADEASIQGDTLHRMVDCMLTSSSLQLPTPHLTSPLLATPHLSALTECAESNSKPSVSNTDISTQDLSRLRSESDYGFDILEDNNLETAVETVTDTKKDGVQEDFPLHLRSSKSIARPLSSTTVLEKLETALYSQISGTFQKRLRIKNLTLTPKRSLQQVFLVQSGDAGSLLLKSTVSNLKMNKCSAESLHDLKRASPVLSNTHIDWTFAQFPMQIATTGYAFPEYQTTNASNSKAKLLNAPKDENSETTNQTVCQSDKTIQCFKGANEKPLADTGAQVEFMEQFETKSVPISVASDVMDSQMLVETEKIELSNETPNNLETVNEVEGSDGIDTSIAVENTDNGVEDKIKETSERNDTVPSPDSVEYTTSLDMLMGILNEIQKITCQNQIAAASNDQSCADLETILNDAALFEKANKNASCDLVSTSSLDNLRQLESSYSACSLCVSYDDDTANDNVDPTEVQESNATKLDNDSIAYTESQNGCINKESVNIVTEDPKRVSVDKQVSANVFVKEYMDNSISVQSSLVPITVNRSANVSNSAIGVISQPSIQSIVSFTNYYQKLYSDALFNVPSIKKIIELPQVKVNEQLAFISREKTVLDEKCFATGFSSVDNIEGVKIEAINVIARRELRSYCAKDIDLDPMFKIKRDILVTVYSVLVFTLFAALSFPELIIFQ